MNKKPFEPNFKTPQEQYCKEELNKLSSQGFVGNLGRDFHDPARGDLPWEAEALAKSHGVYLEYDRAKTGDPKDWIFMVRISVLGGGPITRDQYNLIDELSEKYGHDSDGRPSIRLTNRQNIQFHWIRKAHVPEVVKRLAESGLNTLNGCGDNTRNLLACPCSSFSTDYDANAMARKTGAYFQLPVEPFIKTWDINPRLLRNPAASFKYGPTLLNRKFKIAFPGVLRDEKTGALLPDNCTEALTNDMAVIPVIENNKVARFQIHLGGGQGERNGKPSTACLALPFCQVEEADLHEVMDAVVQVQQEWGDRQNRFWARLKYVIKKMGIDWYRNQVETHLGRKLLPPNPLLDPGPRHLHHGWIRQPSNGLWSYGAFIENGRIIDESPNGNLKSMIRHLMNHYPVELRITPNQDILFCNIPNEDKSNFEKDLARFGFGKRNGKVYSSLRLHSGACVGLDTCRLAYTESERYQPILIDKLEAMGWGDLKESIGITGCERQCFRPATKTIALIGSGLNRYQLKLGGAEDARFQGLPLLAEDGGSIYLKSIPQDRIPGVIDSLLRFWKANAAKDETVGYFIRRIGVPAILAHFKENPATKDLLEKTVPADCVID